MLDKAGLCLSALINIILYYCCDLIFIVNYFITRRSKYISLLIIILYYIYSLERTKLGGRLCQEAKCRV